MLVEVQPEPLQVGEDLDPERVEQPLAVAPHDQGLDRGDDPVRQDDQQGRRGHGEDDPDGLRLDAVVDPAPDQGGHGQVGQRVETVEHQADHERDRERPQQPPQREARLRRPGLAGVDAGRVGGGRQGVDLGEQLR